MANSALTKITTRAKQIRKASGGSWKAAVKKASAEYRSGGSTKSTNMPKKKRTRRAAPKRRSSAAAPTRRASKRTSSHYVKVAKDLLISEIGILEARKFAAPTKRAKKKLSKQIADKKSKARRLM